MQPQAKKIRDSKTIRAADLAASHSMTLPMKFARFPYPLFQPKSLQVVPFSQLWTDREVQEVCVRVKQQHTELTLRLSTSSSSA